MTSKTPKASKVLDRSRHLELALGSLPLDGGVAVVDVLTAGRLLGMGRTKTYRLAKAGEFPCRVLKVGGRYVVPMRGLRALLGYDNDGASRPVLEEG